MYLLLLLLLWSNITTDRDLVEIILACGSRGGGMAKTSRAGSWAHTFNLNKAEIVNWTWGKAANSQSPQNDALLPARLFPPGSITSLNSTTNHAQTWSVQICEPKGHIPHLNHHKLLCYLGPFFWNAQSLDFIYLPLPHGHCLLLQQRRGVRRFSALVTGSRLAKRQSIAFPQSSKEHQEEEIGEKEKRWRRRRRRGGRNEERRCENKGQ